jgi:hypothetical protein
LYRSWENTQCRFSAQLRQRPQLVGDKFFEGVVSHNKKFTFGCACRESILCDHRQRRLHPHCADAVIQHARHAPILRRDVEKRQPPVLAVAPQPLGCAAFKWVTKAELADFQFPAAAAQLLEKLKVESKVKNLFG